MQAAVHVGLLAMAATMDKWITKRIWESEGLPVVLKEIVNEMRFDGASAKYAEFGPFFTGLVLDPAEALARVGFATDAPQ